MKISCYEFKDFQKLLERDTICEQPLRLLETGLEGSLTVRCTYVQSCVHIHRCTKVQLGVSR